MKTEKVYRVCWCLYGQTYVKANSPAEAEEIAQKKFDVKGTPDVTTSHNSWEMIEETEVVTDWELDWNSTIKRVIEEEVTNG